MGKAQDKLKKLIGIRSGSKNKPKGLLHSIPSRNQKLKETIAPITPKKKKSDLLPSELNYDKIGT